MCKTPIHHRSFSQPAVKPSTQVKNSFLDAWIKTNYRVQSFADLGRLNEEQKVEMEGWAWLVEMAKATEPLTVLHDNACAIHVQLTRAHEHVQDTPSRLEQCRIEVARMNEAARALAALGTQFGPTSGPLSQRLAEFPTGTTEEHLQSLCRWVQQRTGQSVANPTRVYQATVDGFTGGAFWRKGQGKGRLLMVVRSVSGYLFGGFTPLGFNHGQSGYHADAQAFLFTLHNPHGIAPTMLPSTNNGQALYSTAGNLPRWGSGHDLYLTENCHTRTSSSANLNSGYTDTTGIGNTLFTGAQHLGIIAEIVAFTV
jgi:hypothetical protein